MHFNTLQIIKNLFRGLNVSSKTSYILHVKLANKPTLALLADKLPLKL